MCTQAKEKQKCCSPVHLRTNNQHTHTNIAATPAVFRMLNTENSF